MVLSDEVKYCDFELEFKEGVLEIKSKAASVILMFPPGKLWRL